MWIDSHCHLDASEFDPDRDAVVARARAAGVQLMVLPAVNRESFARVRDLAHQHGLAYALGIHPLALQRADPADVAFLRTMAAQSCADPRFVAIGEIGLDFTDAASPAPLQEWYYREQLAIARELDLPVILHVRRSADRLLYYLRRVGASGGIAHAFNGSALQAQGFLDLGLRLGFGGAATYDGSLRIRRFAAQLPAAALVLETDAPDIPPQWLRDGGRVERNEPAQLPRIAALIAGLRGCSVAELAATTRTNTLAALPRLAASCTPAGAATSAGAAASPG
jgi:TatD DNase family protein